MAQTFLVYLLHGQLDLFNVKVDKIFSQVFFSPEYSHITLSNSDQYFMFSCKYLHGFRNNLSQSCDLSRSEENSFFPLKGAWGGLGFRLERFQVENVK